MVEDLPSPQKPLTFEELLREIEGMKKPEPAPVSQSPAPEPAYVDYDEEPREERKVLEDTDYDYRKQDKIYAQYEEAKQQAFVRPSLEETIKLEDTIIRFNEFSNYDKIERNNKALEYRKSFKDKESFRKAFIMAEIMNRRF